MLRYLHFTCEPGTDETLDTLPRANRALEPVKKAMYPGSDVNASTTQQTPGGKPPRGIQAVPGPVYIGPSRVRCGTAGIRDKCGTGGGG